jgi:hypothetical protein
VRACDAVTALSQTGKGFVQGVTIGSRSPAPNAARPGPFAECCRLLAWLSSPSLKSQLVIG